MVVGGQGRGDDLAFGVDEVHVVSADFVGFGVDVDNDVEFAHQYVISYSSLVRKLYYL